MTCVINGQPCEHHAGVIHGDEAEELRSGIERIVDTIFEDEAEVREALMRLLNRVDARDSLAFLETAPKPSSPEEGGVNSGHGHVWPRMDGVKARCGGPALCKACAADLARYQAEGRD